MIRLERARAVGHRFWRDLLAAPLRRPKLVCALAAAVTTALAAQLPSLKTDASIEAMIVAADADRLAFEEMKVVFGNDEVISIAIPFDDPASPHAMVLQQQLAVAIEAVPGVLEVDSLATTDDIFGNGDDLVVRPLIEPGQDPRSMRPTEYTHVRERVDANSIWKGLLISRDKKAAAIQIRLDDLDSDSGGSAQAVAKIDRIAAEILGEHSYYLAGHPFMKSEIARTMRGDLKRFLPYTVLVMAGALAVFGTSSPVLGLMLLGASIAGVVLMVGTMALLKFPLTPLSSASPTILLALGTAYLMHLVAAYEKEFVGGDGSAAVVGRALARVRMPTALAGATTAIGFGSLLFSEIPLVRGFGAYLGVGILWVVLLACFVLPAVLSWVAPAAKPGPLSGGKGLGALLLLPARAVLVAPGWILSAGLVVLVTFGWFATGLEVDTSGPSAFSPDSRFRLSSDFYRDHLSGDVIESVYLESREADAFKDPKLLSSMLEFQSEAEGWARIDKSISIANYIAFMNRGLRSNDPSEEAIPRTREAVAQYLLLYSLSGDPGEFDDLVNPSYSRARIVFRATVPSSKHSAKLRDDLTALARTYFPANTTDRSVLSTEILLSRAADAVAREQIYGFGGALVLMVLVVAATLRSLSAGLYLLLPNALPIAVSFGVMALVGLDLSQSTAIVAVIALGIAVDSTVHLFVSYRSSRPTAVSPSGAILYSLQTTGRPVAITTCIVIAGFSLLLLSDFRMVADLGGLTATTIACCLVADLLVLPAQILFMERLRGRDSSESGRPTLLEFPDRAVSALAIDERSDGASFRLLGESSNWAGWKPSEVRVRWPDGARAREGKVVALEDVAAPVLRVAWANERGSERKGG